MRRESTGFSLIELMITLSILGITVMMGIPAFTESRTRSEVRSAANEVASAVRWARSEALRTNQGGRVELASGKCPDGSDAAWVVQIALTPVRCASLADFTSRFPHVNPLTAATINFTSSGVLTNAVPGYVLNSTAAGLSRILRVEQSGRVFESSNEASI